MVSEFGKCEISLASEISEISLASEIFSEKRIPIFSLMNSASWLANFAIFAEIANRLRTVCEIR